MQFALALADTIFQDDNVVTKIACAARRAFDTDLCAEAADFYRDA